MKKLLLSLTLLALLAAPSFAYVQGGQLQQNTPQGNPGDTRIRGSRWMEVTPVTNPAFVPLGDDVARPIPEPGTMVLASLGLLALGASRAKRRGR